MALIRARAQDVRNLARLMRAEAEEERKLGMHLVGTVGVNRIRGNCLDFKGIRTIDQMIWQTPGGFVAPKEPYYHSLKLKDKDIRLARSIAGGYLHPYGRRALWFFKPPTASCPPRFPGTTPGTNYLIYRTKNHCFYETMQCPAL